MSDELEVYELLVTIVHDNGVYAWTIGQELEFDNEESRTEFLAGGEEFTLTDAVGAVSAELGILFPEENA